MPVDIIADCPYFEHRKLRKTQDPRLKTQVLKMVGREMGKSESKGEKQQKERRYDPELLKKGLRCDLDQYKRLIDCSRKGEEGIKEWNEWREKNPNEEILLEGAKFQSLFMDQVHLDEDAANRPGKVYLEDAVFRSAELNKARFMKADLRGCDFRHAHLNEATLILADIRDADFSYAQLRGAKLPFVIVNEKTRFFKGAFDRRTWFWGVALHSMRIADEMRLLLEYNVRRGKWEKWYRYQDWYEGCPKMERSRAWKALRWPVRVFWWTSDYGLSTGRIIVTFFALAFVFANIYYHWGRMAPPGIVENLFTDRNGISVHWLLVPLRTLYFSIVTMTTLGFGDMYANAHSVFGHILLSIQVILGYVLLGALVTRFAVLFTAGGPAGKFADEKGEKDETE